MLFFVVFGIYFFVLLTGANDCTDGCDVTYNSGYEVNFCGTDFINHVSHYEAFDTKCYDVCGVMTLWQGCAVNNNILCQVLFVCVNLSCGLFQALVVALTDVIRHTTKEIV